MTTDLIMGEYVRTATTNNVIRSTDKLVTVDGCRGMVGTSSTIFRVRTGDDDWYC